MILLSCAGAPTSDPEPADVSEDVPGDASDDVSDNDFADVPAVSATGQDGDWTFSVTILSPDTGCEQYADWWEVLSPEGELLFRRILNHSHPDEQPFTRTGSPVPVAGSDEVIVRAHLHPTGYGGAAMLGSVSSGFSTTALTEGFAASVETADPQPDGCAF